MKTIKSRWKYSFLLRRPIVHCIYHYENCLNSNLKYEIMIEVYRLLELLKNC